MGGEQKDSNESQNSVCVMKPTFYVAHVIRHKPRTRGAADTVTSELDPQTVSE